MSFFRKNGAASGNSVIVLPCHIVPVFSIWGVVAQGPYFLHLPKSDDR